MKRISLIFLLMAMGLAVFCGEAVAEPIYFEQDTYAQLMTEINSSEEKNITIILKENIKGGMSFNNPGATITLLGNGHTLNLGKGHISVLGDDTGTTTLILGKPDGRDTLTITGIERNDDPGALYIQKNGVCTMNEGVTITGITNNNYLGGGVSVDGGRFNMNGGTISNCMVDGGSTCHGGGVAVYNNGIFNMSGGMITGCKALTGDSWSDYDIPDSFSATGGGVYVGMRSTFTMSGGTINDCYASINGGGIMVQGSFYNARDHRNSDGYWMYGYLDSQFEMTGGTIQNCQAGHNGGGIAVDGRYDLWIPIGGSDIEPEERVGRVVIRGKNLENGPLIRNNTAQSMNDNFGGGGALYVYQVKQHIPVNIEYARIENNNSFHWGAGILSLNVWIRLNIRNSRITGNIANSHGGGLAIYQNFNGVDENNTNAIIVENTELCNNISNTCGSDVYARNSQVKLPRAVTMGKYTGVPYETDGIQIDGWYTDDNGSRYVANGTRTLFPSYANITLDKQEHFLIAAANPQPVTVTFNANGHGTAPAPQTHTTGEKVKKPDELTAPGYIFTGWYTDVGCTAEYDFNTPLTGDLTLYAGWKQLKYTLHYGDGRPDDGKVGYYDPEAPKALPTEVRHFSEKDAGNPQYPGVEGEGYYFLAWTRTDENGQQFIEVQTPESDCGNIEYYAHWMKIVINIEADISTDVTIESGQSLVEVDESQKDALAKNINPEEDIRGDNCKIEIIMTVTDKQLPPNELASANAALAKALGVILSNHRLDYDISVLKRITVNGKEVEREQLKELAEPIEITFAIPIEWQTGGKVHVFRTHTTPDGTTTTVELDVLQASAQSCTVRTDEFSVYTLVFVPDQSATDALPKTGDRSSIPLLLGVALLAVAGIALLRKKR